MGVFASVAVSIKSILKKFTLVCERRLENLEVQLKSTWEAYEFAQKAI